MIFDRDWNFLSDVKFAYDNKYEGKITKPTSFDKMCEVAKILSSPFLHCRVDFFVLGDSFYIGEMTFYNGAGFDLVTPKEWNLKFGSWIQLPK